MPQPLNANDIQSLNQILVIGGVKQFYASMDARGYHYASWASGVAGSLGMAAIASADFLRGTALMGLGSPIFQILNPQQIGKLRHDIAKSYLRLLHRLIRDHPEASIARDIDADEVCKVHAEGLERNGLSVENWNLHFPLSVLRRLGGEPALAIYWEFMRDARRQPPHIGLLANLATIAFMYRQTMAEDVRCRQMATAWVARNPALYGYSEIERRLEAALNLVRNTEYPALCAFLDVLDIEQHGVTGGDWRPQLQRADPKARACHRAVTTEGASPEWIEDEEAYAVYKELMRRLTLSP